ncbi:hypothetical protein RND81_13G052900 [Saponaria officinalis]|uniref:DUF4216 domain-containing protein n=1 Tax=Saponaria officinalis TaxID=3572 RepID=A0AAW1GU98_SAPOF
MTVHRNYNLVDVNHSRKYPTYDPFVLSYQVDQVYFTKYPSLKRDKDQWSAVFKTKARSNVDAPADENAFQEHIVTNLAQLSAPIDVEEDLNASNDVTGDNEEEADDEEMINNEEEIEKEDSDEEEEFDDKEYDDEDEDEQIEEEDSDEEEELFPDKDIAKNVSDDSVDSD